MLATDLFGLDSLFLSLSDDNILYDDLLFGGKHTMPLYYSQVQHLVSWVDTTFVTI